MAVVIVLCFPFYARRPLYTHKNERKKEKSKDNYYASFPPFFTLQHKDYVIKRNIYSAASLSLSLTHTHTHTQTRVGAHIKAKNMRRRRRRRLK